MPAYENDYIAEYDMSNARFDGDRPASEGYDHRLTTSNRFAQVGWLRELAGDIASWAGEGTAEELVEYSLNEEGWCIEMPSWFDEHDRRLLTNMVRRRIA